MSDIEGLPDPYEGERLDRDARLCGRAWREGWAAREAADERLREAGVWPDQSAMHGVLLDQIKDAYAEGIADTIDRIRVRAAEMLPEVARFTLDEIEALAAADREAPDEETTDA